jgi:hypothetical protein
MKLSELALDDDFSIQSGSLDTSDLDQSFGMPDKKICPRNEKTRVNNLSTEKIERHYVGNPCVSDPQVSLKGVK